jgi:hypothetical protein
MKKATPEFLLLAAPSCSHFFFQNGARGRLSVATAPDAESFTLRRSAPFAVDVEARWAAT